MNGISCESPVVLSHFVASLILVNGVTCEFHYKASGTRRIQDCPNEEYCVALYRSYYDNDYARWRSTENKCLVSISLVRATKILVP